MPFQTWRGKQLTSFIIIILEFIPTLLHRDIYYLQSTLSDGLTAEDIDQRAAVTVDELLCLHFQLSEKL